MVPAAATAGYEDVVLGTACVSVSTVTVTLLLPSAWATKLSVASCSAAPGPADVPWRVSET